ETVDQLAVRDAVEACSRVEAGDPQRAHLALALLSADVGVRHGVELRLARRLDQPRSCAAAAFSRVEKTLVSLVGGDAALDACHDVYSLRMLEVGQQPTDLGRHAGIHDCLAVVPTRAARGLD